MRFIFTILLCLSSGICFGQSETVFFDSIKAGYLYDIPAPNPTQLWGVNKRAHNITNAVMAYVGSAGFGTVTSITGGYGLHGGTITTVGTLYIDTFYIATRLRVKKQLDSLANLYGTVTSITSGWGTNFSTITTSGSIAVDSAFLATKLRVKKQIDSIASLITSGTVTSVSATAGTGINISGSPITTSGTLTITNTAPDQTVSLTDGYANTISGTYPNFTITNDTTKLSTLKSRQKAVDSLNAIIATKGTGSVTSVSAGYGMTFTTITGTGSVTADTAYLCTKLRALKLFDSITANANNWTATQTITKAAGGAMAVTGLTLQNTTAATSGTQQSAPKIQLLGYGFKTNDNTSQSVLFELEPSSVSGAANPSGVLYVKSTLAGGATSTLQSWNSNGTSSINTLSVSNATTLQGAINVTSGANKNINTATLSSGTVTVSNTRVTANSKIFIEYNSGSALSLGIGNVTTQFVVTTITAGTSFVITAYTGAGITNTTDNSTVMWFFLN